MPHSFELFIKASPNLDIINIGDTIWFSIDDSNFLKDLHTSELINYKGAANLSTPLAVFEILGPQSLAEAANQFEYIIKKGHLIYNYGVNLISEIVFIESDIRYQLEVGIVPKNIGVFKVLFTYAANVYTHSDGCLKATFQFVFNNTDQHFDLGYNISGPGVYYFKVR
jgi:hypothetical protein